MNRSPWLQSEAIAITVLIFLCVGWIAQLASSTISHLIVRMVETAGVR